MSLLDYIVVVLFVIGCAWGAYRGFFRQLASLLGLIVGLIVARNFYQLLAAKISPSYIDSLSVAQVISFLTIWIIVPLLFSIIANVLTRFFDIIPLGCLNRALGGILGGLKTVIVLGLIVGVLDVVDPENNLINRTKKKESMLYNPLQSIGSIFIVVLQQTYEEQIK